MKGGKLTCRRKGFYENENGNNCIKMSCFDYKKRIYNVFEKDICDDWEEYWDDQAQAKYWYNHLTGEATWIKPNPTSLIHIKNIVNNAGKVFVPRRQHCLYFQKTRKNKKKQGKTKKNKKKQGKTKKNKKKQEHR